MRNVLLGVCKLLQKVCTELRNDRGPPYIIDEGGCGMEVGALSMVCLSTIGRSLMRCIIFVIPRP